MIEEPLPLVGYYSVYEGDGLGGWGAHEDDGRASVCEYAPGLELWHWLLNGDGECDY